MTDEQAPMADLRDIDEVTRRLTTLYQSLADSPFLSTDLVRTIGDAVLALTNIACDIKMHGPSKDDASLLQAIDERDAAQAAADRLAYAIASPEAIGEHTSGNDPWANAVRYAESLHGFKAAMIALAERWGAVPEPPGMLRPSAVVDAIFAAMARPNMTKDEAEHSLLGRLVRELSRLNDIGHAPMHTIVPEDLAWWASHPVRANATPAEQAALGDALAHVIGWLRGLAAEGRM